MCPEFTNMLAPLAPTSYMSQKNDRTEIHTVKYLIKQNKFNT